MLVTEQAPSDVLSSPSISKSLWDEAYDNLKKSSESKVVDAYEKILSQELKEGDPGSDLSNTKNSIAQENDPAERCSQMKQLVQIRLDKTEKEDKTKQAVGEVMQVVLSVKDVVSSAIASVPQAALPWTGVCFALQVVCSLLTYQSLC